jgi:hypothetical protein
VCCLELFGILPQVFAPVCLCIVFPPHFSICTSLRAISNTSFSSLVVSKFVASILALDCTSCATLTYNLYSTFVGILANTNSICSMSLTCFCTMSLSICNMSLVMLKFSLATCHYLYCFFLTLHGMSCSYVVFCCCVCPLCCTLVNCICSKTCLTSFSSCIIFSLCFSASSYSSVVWSCTLSMTNSTSYFVIVYWGTFLCTFIFLRAPPDCKIVLLSGLDPFSLL